MSAMGPPPYIIASAKIAATTPPTILSGSGVHTPVRDALGIFTLSLSQQCDITDRSCIAGANATAGTIAVVNEAVGTDATIQVFVTDAAAAPVDVNFSVIVVRNS